MPNVAESCYACYDHLLAVVIPGVIEEAFVCRYQLSRRRDQRFEGEDCFVATIAIR